MGYKKILFILLGFIGFKYLLLEVTTFEKSFFAGITYHYTAIIFIALFNVISEIKKYEVTPEFFKAFKLIGKNVIIYSVGASLTVTLWHYYLKQDITAQRLEERIYERKNTFEGSEDYALYVEQNPTLKGINLESWIEKEIEGLKFIFSMRIQTSLTMMLYLVIGLFISLIASFLWTKVWFVK